MFRFDLRRNDETQITSRKQYVMVAAVTAALTFSVMTLSGGSLHSVVSVPTGSAQAATLGVDHPY